MEDSTPTRDASARRKNSSKTESVLWAEIITFLVALTLIAVAW
jgi:hypothetical protein